MKSNIESFRALLIMILGWDTYNHMFSSRSHRLVTIIGPLAHDSDSQIKTPNQ